RSTAVGGGASPHTAPGPARGRTEPTRILISVDLPAPFAPSRPKISPRPTSRLTPLRASMRPYRLRTPSTAMAGPAARWSSSRRVSVAVIIGRSSPPVVPSDASPNSSLITRRSSLIAHRYSVQKRLNVALDHRVVVREREGGLDIAEHIGDEDPDQQRPEELE